MDHGQIIADDTADARDVTLADSTVEFRAGDGPTALPELVVAARELRVPVRSAEVFRPTLDDLFLNLTGRSLRETDTTTTATTTDAVEETKK